MKVLMWCVGAMVGAAVVFSYALDRNFTENAGVLAMELNNYELIEDPLDLIERDSELAWIYMEGVVLAGSDAVEVPQESRSYEREGYEKYHTVNSDTVGYINIENSKVDYPVLWSQDNAHYLDYDVYGQKSSSGAIYLDAYSEGKWGRVNLVHGHSMRNGTMFRDVLNYVKQDWCDAHREIRIFDGQRDKVYEVFSVFILDANKEAVPLYYDSEEAFQSWLEGVKGRSLVSGGTVYDDSDLLVLNTCSYQFSGAHTIVVASRVQ